MKLLTFSLAPGLGSRVGVIDKGKVVDLALAYRRIHEADPPNWLAGMDKLLVGGETALKLVKNLVHDVAKVFEDKDSPDFVYEPAQIIYYPPVTNPGKVLCVAVNYRGHAAESGARVPEEPYVFTKLSDVLIGHNWPIVLSKSSNQGDIEIELALIIGRSGKYISRSEADEYIAGYTIFNDVSFRDRRVNRSDPQRINWLHLKSLDTAGPTGPWLVTRDEITDPHALRIIASINGGGRQEGWTGDMVHKVPELIEYISNGITLKPGDIIATGTPHGIAFSKGRFLKDGDIVKAEIEGIGTLVNPVLKEI